jgi:V-type H+-transporting ATPase subunit C
MATSSYCIAAISNGGGAPEQAYRKMQSAGACPEKPFAEMFKFEVPSLMVGTLDRLMVLGDELGKTDQIVESIVRKIERSALELTMSVQSGKEPPKDGLTVGGVPSSRYIQQFAWDYAKYPNRRPLQELVAMIGGSVTAIDEELRQLQQSYLDKQTTLHEGKRKKQTNLMAADLNDVLTAAEMQNVQVHDTEYLKTLFIAVPSNAEVEFKKEIYSLGCDLVGFGGPDWSRDSSSLGQPFKFGTQVDRFKTKGSPVVPNSLVVVKNDGEVILYAITILKAQYTAGHYEGDEFISGGKIDLEELFSKAVRDKRYAVRNFKYDPSQAQRTSMALEQLNVEVESMKNGLARWCKTHYGETFVAWMHIKVIRVFVESVLRYGLPVDFTSVLYKCPYGKEKDLVDALDAALGTAPDKNADEDEGEEYHDFVLLRFEP